MKSLIKWVGGKTQLLPELLRVFPKSIENYYEPFLGGGAVFFALASSKEHPFVMAHLNDLNEELVNTYTQVAHDHERLCLLLTQWKEMYLKDPKTFYYDVRKDDPKTMLPLDRAARFIFLNKTGFNGLYRVNKSGGFNVPWGKHENPTLFDQDNIEACSRVLRKAKITSGDYTRILDRAGIGDLVYFDPPYVPLNPTSNFTSYTSDGFTIENQKQLASTFRELSDRGVHVVLSNSDTEVIRDLYKEFAILTIFARRAVNSKGSGRGPVNEVLVLSKTASETFEGTI
jgi:DNA adenine methylase